MTVQRFTEKKRSRIIQEYKNPKSDKVDSSAENHSKQEQITHQKKLHKAPFLENNPRIDNLDQKIDLMRKYGERLAKEDEDKGKTAKKLAYKLKEKVDIFVQNAAETDPQSGEINRFKLEFIDLLHSKDKSMDTYKKAWKPIVDDILAALSGIGLVALTIKSGSNAVHSIRNNKPFTFNDSCFFARTRREEQVQEIESALSFIKP
ncbi:hypothetical protein [Legionella londiniensis]|uniref:Ankyrin repeat protein n=1 Tax=Legionella londiniensis TaxID=45068 RepID=A0A0W0VQY6_9GAMM|nr:hypothetical protein [Legionella londiniensis]KTD22580.1 Ankyrin repeat protein [Legionella londiniensis]STX92511.1 Ankyrin repeat protein [Legionella londiniensis]